MLNSILKDLYDITEDFKMMSDDLTFIPPFGGKILKETYDKITGDADEIKEIFDKPLGNDIDIWFYDYTIRKINNKKLKNHIYKTNNSLSFITYKISGKDDIYTVNSRHAMFSIGLDNKLWRISFKARVVFQTNVVARDRLVQFFSSINDFLNTVAIQDMNKIMIYPFKKYWLMKYPVTHSQLVLKSNSDYRLAISENTDLFKIQHSLFHIKETLDKQDHGFDMLPSFAKRRMHMKLSRKITPKVWTKEEKEAIENLDMEGLSKITVDDVINSIIDVAKEYPWDETLDNPWNKTLDKQEEK